MGSQDRLAHTHSSLTGKNNLTCEGEVRSSRTYETKIKKTLILANC